MFGIDRTVQNMVGSSEYGLYFALFNFTLILNILLDLGITNFNNRNISQHNFLLNKHLSNVLTLKFVLFFVYSVVIFTIGFIIGYNRRQFLLLVFLVINQFLLSLILYLRSNVTALQLFKTDSILSVLDRFIMIIFCSIIIWTNVFPLKMSIEVFTYIQTISYLISAIFCFYIVLKKSGRIKLKFDYHFFLVFLKKSYPYALLVLLMSFYNRFDGVLLERLLENGEYDAGIYAQSFRILDALSMVAYLFSGILLPMFSNMLKKKEEIYPLLQLSYRLIIVPSLIFIVISILYSDKIIDLLYHHNPQNYSSTVFRILIIGLFATATTYVYGALLTANGNLKQLNIMALLTLLINISLNFVLIPKYKAVGSAIASASAQLFSAFYQILLANKVFNFKVNYKFISQLCGLIIIIVISYLLLNLFVLKWYVVVFMLCIISFVYIYMTKTLELKSIAKMFLYKNETF
ncbi:MAG: oligosaccharide flippase family protein [Bacteroidales bacterium]|nr:oligosaccharide flippase family protein [Bacteroidales bacterium]